MRPTVISRKISFSLQSKKRVKIREILMTPLDTAQACGHGPAEFLRKFMDMLAKNRPAEIAEKALLRATITENRLISQF